MSKYPITCVIREEFLLMSLSSKYLNEGFIEQELISSVSFSGSAGALPADGEQEHGWHGRGVRLRCVVVCLVCRAGRLAEAEGDAGERAQEGARAARG